MKAGGLPLVLVLACLAGASAYWLLSRSSDAALRNRAADHREVALRILGQHLARQYPNGKALILSNPFVPRGVADADARRFEAAGIRGLERGWGRGIRLLDVVYPALRPEALAHPETVPVDPESRTPLGFLQTERAWDELLRAHPDADVWVSLIGVPVNLTALEVWRRPKPRLALLLPDVRMLGGRSGVLAGLESGKLAALVLARPGAPPDSAPRAADDRAEFERRFLLVTRDNVTQVLALYPGLF